MKDSITVTYLKKSYVLDISTEDKLHSAANKITQLIMKKAEPIYSLIFMRIYDIQDQTEMYGFVKKKAFEYIKENVEEYIRYNENINVDGFIIFRLKNLWDIVDNAISEFLKKDYLILTDFFNSYINSIPSVYETIHIIATEKSYNVYDNENEMIAYIRKYDDTLLDIIINIAPKKIFIYNQEKFVGKTLLENIRAIFKDKAVFDTK